MPLTQVPISMTDASTQQKIDAFVPTGTILPFAGSAAPSGFLLCDGKSYSQSVYASLFSVIGTAYGSLSAGNFSVPDFRGSFLRGSTADLTNKTLGVVDTVNETITITGHGYNRSGVPVRFTGSIPTGLNTTSTWYTIYIDDNTLAFASTQDLATQAVPSRVNLTTTTTGGTIVQYIDPDASTRIRSNFGSASGNSLGSFQDDQFESHTHAINGTTNPAGGAQSKYAWGNDAPSAQSVGAQGGTETRPVNASVNYIIKT
jgi:microcystin-dependent protein